MLYDVVEVGLDVGVGVGVGDEFLFGERFAREYCVILVGVVSVGDCVCDVFVFVVFDVYVFLCVLFFVFFRRVYARVYKRVRGVGKTL